MRDHPLLDLADAWRDIQARLLDLQEQADAIYAASAETWQEILTLRTQVRLARTALGALAPGLLKDIAEDRAALEDWAAKLG